MHSLILRTLLFFFVSSALVACGGGSGSEDNGNNNENLSKVSNLQIGNSVLNADKKTYSVTVKWDGSKDAKTWLYVHGNNAPGPKHDASNNSYTYTKLLGGYTFDIYVQSENGNVIKKTFKTKKIPEPVSNLQIGNPVLNADKKTYSVTVKWDGSKDAKTWLYVHGNNAPGPKHDASNNSYTYTKLLGGYTFDIYVQSEIGKAIKKTFKTEKIADDNMVGIEKQTINFDDSTSQYISGFLDNSRVEVDEIGLYLSDQVQSNVDNDSAMNPDIVYDIQAGEAAGYYISTTSSLNAKGKELLKDAEGAEGSLMLKIQIGEKIYKREMYVSWKKDEPSYTSKLGKFYLNGKKQTIKIWLPQGVIFKSVSIEKYKSASIPEEAKNYEPAIVPPDSHPRVWVTPSSLQKVKNNLEVGMHQELWGEVKTVALKPYEYPYEKNEVIVKPNNELEEAIKSKAFYYLMTGDKNIGREALDIAKKYILALDMGNHLHASRYSGAAIYVASLAYDWCYDLLTDDEKRIFIDNFKYLAESMEIGWPPFKKNVTYGHGSESMLSQELLAMSIAIYDEDPTPYQYTSYRVLEELVPMREFQYQSSRHLQGMSYGPTRYKYDLYAATLFKKMSNKAVFDKNVIDVYGSFFYRHLTSTSFFSDGDVFSQYYYGIYSNGSKMDYGELSLLHYAYSKDHEDKKLVSRLSKSGIGVNNYYSVKKYSKILMLILNDPNIEEEKTSKVLKELPLTKFTEKIRGSMMARTGWDMSERTDDVVVDIKGGGYRFAGHSHSDAGSFQISYRGKQVVDLGQYAYFGTSYDMNFQKRSIAHSMMLVVDPSETDIEDGGTKLRVKYPPAHKKAITDNLEHYANGEVISQSSRPAGMAPDFSYFAVDLASAYSKKIEKYQRKSLFINLKNSEVPAVFIVLDTIKTSNAEFKKYWQINTLNKPDIENGVITLSNSRKFIESRTLKEGKKGHVVVNMLKPRAADREIKMFSGKDSTTVFGKYYAPPKPDKPEANGTRIMISPYNPSQDDEFLTAFTMKTPEAEALPISYEEAQDQKTLHVSVGDNILVVMNKTEKLLRSNISISVVNPVTKLLVTGLESGAWILSNNGIKKTITVTKGENTAYFKSLSSGDYTLVRQ